MGLEISQQSFGPEDYSRFGKRLSACLTALRGLLATPGFGEGDASIGAELELSLIDADGNALPLNRAVLADALDPRFTVELDRFNLECNLRHAPLAGQPFAHLEREFDGALTVIRRAAAQHGGRVVPIGVLPTLRSQDMSAALMTDSVRYRMLSSALRRTRQRPFEFHIDGEDPLHLQREDVTFEGAATSLQLHLRVDPGAFSDAFNAAQLATAPVLAVAGNSPTFIGHRLWQETRIALFKQAVDDRTSAETARHAAPRVCFGNGWLSGGALTLFEAAAARDALLPVCSDEDPLSVPAGSIPKLEELRLHAGTVWSWNRAVYDPAAGGHLRIELRALPSGPSVPDMLANSAFLLGLTRYLQPQAATLTAQLPFQLAEHNFYRAAQQGMGAQLYWPDARTGEPRLRDAVALATELLPKAREGLRQAGVSHGDAEPWLEVMAERLRMRRSGADWQLATLRAHEAAGQPRKTALSAMLERYLQHSESKAPVHSWPLPDEPVTAVP